MSLGILLVLWIINGVAMRRYCPILVLYHYQRIERTPAQAINWACYIAVWLSAIVEGHATVGGCFAGLIFWFAGLVLSVRAMQDNPYFQPKIEAPPFRIVDGTYAYFDHPGYMGIALQFLGTICIVGTTTAFIAFAAHTIFLAYRAMVENRLLRGL